MSPSLLHYCSLSREETEDFFKRRGWPRFRADQFFHALYKRRIFDPANMTNLPAAMREALASDGSAALPEIAQEQISTDGTRKWLVKFADGKLAETVYIPETGRGTLCVSSQIGCSLTCSFCHTGTQKLQRNLTADEIVGQYLLAEARLGQSSPDIAERGPVTNVVMMGMGEPLINYDNVARALRILMEPEGIGFSKRKITLSTSGYVPKIVACGEELGVNLAVSLHATTDEVRDSLVPLNRKYPIAALLEACRAYPHNSAYRRMTFEYVMLDGINDADADAERLAEIIAPIPAKVNLIPFNPWPGSAYRCSPEERIARFAHMLERRGAYVTVRTPRGRDIFAACGQLKSANALAVA
ncbi:MAG: 23S rRNA (adenine(2503)-C(2))-methyltransferase RlmN [Rickettsiales bacterium]